MLSPTSSSLSIPPLPPQTITRTNQIGVIKKLLLTLYLFFFYFNLSLPSVPSSKVTTVNTLLLFQMNQRMSSSSIKRQMYNIILPKITTTTTTTMVAVTTTTRTRKFISNLQQQQRIWNRNKSHSNHLFFGFQKVRSSTSLSLASSSSSLSFVFVHDDQRRKRQQQRQQQYIHNHYGPTILLSHDKEFDTQQQKQQQQQQQPQLEDTDASGLLLNHHNLQGTFDDTDSTTTNCATKHETTKNTDSLKMNHLQPTDMKDEIIINNNNNDSMKEQTQNSTTTSTSRSNSSNSSSSNTNSNSNPIIQTKNNANPLVRRVRKYASNMISIYGFVSSSTNELFFTNSQQLSPATTTKTKRRKIITQKSINKKNDNNDNNNNNNNHMNSRSSDTSSTSSMNNTNLLLSSFSSSFSSLSSSLLSKQTTYYQTLRNIYYPLYQSFLTFIINSGIYDNEFKILLNRKLLDHIIIFSTIQQKYDPVHTRREQTTKTTNTIPIPSSIATTSINSSMNTTKEKALRYLKYATAVYGEHMIRSVEMHLTGQFDTSSLFSSWSLLLNSPVLLPPTATTNGGVSSRTMMDPLTIIRQRIRSYCNLQSVEDIILINLDSTSTIAATDTTTTNTKMMNLDSTNNNTRSESAEDRGMNDDDFMNLKNDDNTDYDYDENDENHNDHLNVLKHFIAIDHQHKEIVLAIRGTFSLTEIIVDVAAFSRPFCGGEAHSEMSAMAERIWKATSNTILSLLDKYQDYDLILTGHSLGAGTASLINIMLHHDNYKLMNECKNRIQCVVYACPPVFTSLQHHETNPTFEQSIQRAIHSCTNYIHQNDCVPFLSVDSVRHFLYGLRLIQEEKIRWTDRMKIMTQYTTPPPSLIEKVEVARTKRLDTLPGAPQLLIPAASNIWLQEHVSDDEESAFSRVYYYDQMVCDAHALANIGISVNPSMWDDHMPSRYEQALQGIES